MGLRDQFKQIMASELEHGGKLPFLLNDMVIEEQLCQMRCAYCLTEEYNLLMNVPDAPVRLATDMRDDWHRTLRAYHEYVDSPILRISGGEFFWLKGSTEFVQECSALYETVQIITNGVFLHRKRLETLAALPNVQLNISIDGHTLEMNRHRFPPRQANLFPTIMSHLEDAVGLGIPIEIQCVLTDANVDNQLEFCEFLRDRYDGKVMLYAFPVRGNSTNDFVPANGDYFDEVLDRYEEFSGVLPPYAFVEHIARQLREGTRTMTCYVTATMSQLFGQGDVSACPHAWIDPIGNVTKTPELMPEEFAKHQHYEFFMQDRPRFSFCKGCATPSDIINLYFLDRISEEELGRCRLYAGPRSRARLRELKRLYEPILAPGRARMATIT